MTFLPGDILPVWPLSVETPTPHSTRYAITGMNLADTTGYVRHHLSLAGRSDPLFSDDAISAIHQASRGYPRAVNNLAVAALIATYAADKTIVDQTAAQSAITENTE